MCGIAGIWNVAHGQPGTACAAMLDAMSHRGPDGRGMLQFEGGAAGMVRLALVDLSDRGLQPMWSEDRRVAIIFNGEIYNFRDERKRLESGGHTFRSTTDTEVVLRLYQERGLDFHEHLRGMYALAIFDWRNTAPGKLPTMVLARDPLGIKPLYFARPPDNAEGIVFSSELRGLLASRLVRPEVSRDALANYLAHGFVIQPETMLAGVSMLEPGTLARFAPGENVQQVRFWKMPAYEPKAESLDEAAERLRATLEQSVAIHAMADAPIGAFLSGGIDSTGIVALMRRHIRDLRTYTLRFPDVPNQDEVREAQEAAQAYDCRHTIVDVTTQDVRELLPQFAGELDQPSADGLNTWLISKAAAQDVKGVLSGVGGDEWFAGYPVVRRMSRYATTAGGRSQMIAGKLAHQVSTWIPEGRLRQRTENLATRRDALATWLQSHTVFRDDLARRMVGLEPDPQVESSRLERILSADVDDWRTEGSTGLSCLLDTRVYMTCQLLRDSDATSMAHSLELRTPFVDPALAAFSRTCRDEYKLRPDGGKNSEYHSSGSKRVLIHALRDVLPKSIGSRQKKGFALPFAHWMRGGLSDLLDDTCSQEAVARRGLLDPTAVARLRGHANAAEERPLYPELWTLMIFELWCRAVLDVPQATTSPGATNAVEGSFIQ